MKQLPNSKASFLLGAGTTLASFGILAMILLAVILATNSADQNAADPTDPVPADGGPVETTPIDQVNLDELRYVRSSGPLTFIVYMDLECIFSKKFHPTVMQLIDEYDGSVAFSIKHFPLNIHEKAKREAVAAECAGEQGVFFDYVGALFDRTPSNDGLDDQELFTVAEELGIDMAIFNDCVENETSLVNVAADAIEAESTGGEGTPHSILVDENGNILQTFRGVVSIEQLRAEFDNSLGE